MTLPDLFDDDDDTLLEIELAAERKATKPLRHAVTVVLATLHALWPGDSADPRLKQAAIARLNTDALLTPLPGVQATIMQAALDALSHGVRVASAQAGVDLDPPVALPTDLAEDIRHSTDGMRKQVELGRRVLNDAARLETAEVGVSVMAQGVNRVAMSTRWFTNRAANLGIEQVANATDDVVMIWRAERDACLHCLAYQGQVRKRGGYPRGLTFSAKPLHTKPVPMPPLHPNCRCTQWVIGRDVADPIISALVREAERSVARGWSMESESEKRRVDAAERLLAQGTTLPKSVQQYARSAVRRGRFKRGRRFPGAR